VAGGTSLFDYYNIKTQLRELERNGATHNASTHNDGIRSKGHSVSERQSVA
jgi:hypothetical protein